MRTLGVVRKIDEMGRIVLPKDMRQRQGLIDGTLVEIQMSEEGLVIKKYHPANDLSMITREFEEAVERIFGDLGAGKMSEIKRHIREIERLLPLSGSRRKCVRGKEK